MTDLSLLLEDHQKFHSIFQCRRFITQKAGVTPYGMYKQALRELDGRTWSALDDILTLREEEIKLERLRDRLLAKVDGLLEVKIARAEITIERLRRGLRDRYREWAEFYAQAAHLRTVLGIPEGEPLTEERRAALDEEMIQYQIATSIKCNLLAGERPLSSNIVENILTMPDRMQEPLLASVTHPKVFASWYDSTFSATLAEAPAKMIPSIEEAKVLIESHPAAALLPAPV